MTDRKLPAHIAAALADNPADSAGRPWEGRDLSGAGNPLHKFDNDDGRADPAYVAAVLSLLEGGGDEAAVVRTLATARIFVPILAQVAETAAGSAGMEADKEADMALISLKAPDGRKALPVFTSAAALADWHPDARPVAVFAPRAALSAVADDAELMVIDPGADFTFVVRRPAVWALAQQIEWLPAYVDPEIADIVATLAAMEQDVLQVGLGAGSGVPARSADGKLALGGGAGPELRLEARLRGGMSQEAVQGLLQRFQDQLRSHRQFVERVDSLEVKLIR